MTDSARAPEPASLVVAGVASGYGGAPVLRGVSLTAAAGTITAILGANGAGKKTLLRTIHGAIKPSRGQLLLAGADVSRRRPEDVTMAGIVYLPHGQGGVAAI